MDFDSILKSKILRIIALLVGLYSGAAKIIDFLAPPAVQPILTGLIIVAALYFFALFLKIAIGFLISKLSQQVIENVHSNPSIFRVILDRPKQTDLSEAEQAYKYIAKRYGIGYEDLSVQWNIKDSGSAELQRKITVESFSTIENLDTYLLVPEKDPEGSHRGIDHVKIEALNNKRDVYLAEKKGEDGKLSALIAISPPLSYGENLSFQMLEKLEKGLYAINLTEEEIRERNEPHDYAGWTINRPTKKAILEVYFPENVIPRIPIAEVKYASASGFPSERMHIEEQKSLNSPILLGPEAGRYILRLELDYPMIGLIYILRWRP